MPWVATHELTPGCMSGNANLQTYCGLDTMVTLEVWEQLQHLFNEEPQTYTYERALQGPLLEVMLRGFRVDDFERQLWVQRLRELGDDLYVKLQRMAHAVWDRPLNPRSPKQLIDFFYGAMRIPEQWTSKKGERKLSTDRETLEKLEIYLHARPIIATILAIRDVKKKLEVLETEVDPDGRMRTSYNIAGTETWRLSSSASAFGTGSNLQNITSELRRIFIADAGWKLCVIDLEQAESREVGWLCGVLFGDWSYLDACEGGDLHTTTCKLIWRNLPWTGDPGQDKLVAERPFYRHYSYRDMSKRGGHGSNYYGTPFTMARHLKVPVKFMEDFQRAYFEAFPPIPRWHRWVAQQLQTIQKITTPFGQTRHFFGRPGDDTTLREAIAFSPQSSTAIRTNLALHRMWTENKVQLLAQTHDSITFQYREEHEAEIIPWALIQMETPLVHQGRILRVPGEAKIGWNWGYAKPKPDGSIDNPEGLIKWKGPGVDKRQRQYGINKIMS